MNRLGGYPSRSIADTHGVTEAGGEDSLGIQSSLALTTATISEKITLYPRHLVYQVSISNKQWPYIHSNGILVCNPPHIKLFTLHSKLLADSRPMRKHENRDQCCTIEVNL